MPWALPSPASCAAPGKIALALLLTKVGSSVSVQVPREQLRRAGRFGLRLVTPGHGGGQRGSLFDTVDSFGPAAACARDVARTVSLEHLAPLFKQLGLVGSCSAL